MFRRRLFKPQRFQLRSGNSYAIRRYRPLYATCSIKAVSHFEPHWQNRRSKKLAVRRRLDAVQLRVLAALCHQRFM